MDHAELCLLYAKKYVLHRIRTSPHFPKYFLNTSFFALDEESEEDFEWEEVLLFV